MKRVKISTADGSGGDPVAQMAVKLELEPKVEPVFHPGSDGYRPKQSALDAVGTST